MSILHVFAAQWSSLSIHGGQTIVQKGFSFACQAQGHYESIQRACLYTCTLEHSHSVFIITMSPLAGFVIVALSIMWKVE